MKLLLRSWLTLALLVLRFAAPADAADTGGLFFDGVNEYVTFGAAPGLGAARFTLETWVYWTGGGAAANSGSGGVDVIPLIAKGRGEADGNNRDANYLFGILSGSGVLAADFEEGAGGNNPGLNHPVVGRTALTPNVWHHAAVTYDGANWALYLDGNLDATLPVGQPPRSDSIQHAALGAALNSTGAAAGAFAGALDEVRIWNYARTASQISRQMTVQIPTAPGLLGRWSLDEAGGTTANDSSGNHVNGTLVNDPLWTSGYPFITAPTIALAVPTPGTNLLALTQITVLFSKPVMGVDAGDLLINNVAATGASGTNDTYTFTFGQPAFGNVRVTWATNHGITDLDTPPRPFDAMAAGASWQYFLGNPNAPTILAQTPPAKATINSLTQVRVTFNESVIGVDASDLLVNGAPATGLTGSGATYTFTMPQPPYGPVDIAWAPNPGITDTEPVPNAFDPASPGSAWSYTLVDQTPPTVASQDPPAGATVTNLIQLTVTFSEPVRGVHAADLLINGVPATAVSGAGATYAFAFARFNATRLNISWSPSHGITDLAPVPNAFDGAAPGATWFYHTPDTVPPAIAGITPPPGATVRALTQLVVLFTEPVLGVDLADLLVNAQPPLSLSGSGAGPYTFSFNQPPTGAVTVAWTANPGIADLATPSNAFAEGGNWSYKLDPNARFEGAVVLNEIMYQPYSGQADEEWLELYNTTSDTLNLSGWRFGKGINFTFPNLALAPHGCLVVCANRTVFQARHPGVTNVVGDWVGRLSNLDETLELVDLAGNLVNRVHYADEGDWATHVSGSGDLRIFSLTSSGATATALAPGLYVNGDRVTISGADQPAYNGTYSIFGATAISFSYTLASNAPSPATGYITCRQWTDHNARGYAWASPAHGQGRTMELRNPALANQNGQNWAPSAAPEGTPGQPNSVLTDNLAPLISDVAHFPAVPKSADAVTITARALDEQTNGTACTLFYRVASISPPGPFLSTNMFDDGLHGDGAAGDRYFGAILPPQPNGAVIEFFVLAVDAQQLTNTWPPPLLAENGAWGQAANAHYQVDEDLAPAAPANATQPFYRLILTQADRQALAGNNQNSDAALNATFVTFDGTAYEIRYNTVVRIRGAGSRGRAVRNFRVNIPSDRRWKGLREVNLNTQFIHAQVAGSRLAAKIGMPAAEGRIVQVRVNGANLASSLPADVHWSQSSQGDGFGSYYHVEVFNGDWAQRVFPTNSGGNVYRGSHYPWTANLDYLLGNTLLTNTGLDFLTYVSRGYSKASNHGENDWTDLYRLTWALTRIPEEADYVRAVSTNADVTLCMRFFALGSAYDYRETSLLGGIGDDYAMYCGPTDPRFTFLPHDFDTILGQGDSGGGNPNRSIWMMVDAPYSSDPTQRANFLARFMRHPQFAPIYLRELKRLCDEAFAPEHFNPLLDQVLGGWVPATTITAMKNFASARRASIYAQLPLTFSVNVAATPTNTYYQTTAASVQVAGQANGIETRTVKVSGQDAAWSPWNGQWTTTVALLPGYNNVLVQTFDADGAVLLGTNVLILCDRGGVQTVSGTISTDTTWSAAAGPYNVTSNLTVGSGATLTIEPGATVFLEPGVDLTVANGGRLLAEGTPTAPIRFTRSPANTGAWGNLVVNGSVGSIETRIAYAHFEDNGGSPCIQVSAGTVFFDHLTFGNTALPYLHVDRASFLIQDCVFPSPTASFEPVHGTGGVKSGGRGIFLRNYFGTPTGYNDVIDFTGGNRPGSPIVQFINNVFAGAPDDDLDLDGTDAWIEGNIFLHVHKNGSPDTASAVSGGNDGGNTSEITILGNIFYDCDQAAMGKQGNFFTLINNTIVHQTHVGGQDTDGGVVCLADAGTAEGRGMYLEGNILYDVEKLVRYLTAATVTFTNNLMPLPWSGPGGNNSTANPHLTYLPQLSETDFPTWEAAQVMWQWFKPGTGSPAQGTGPNGVDKGAVIPAGASLAGEPEAVTAQTSATLRVGINRRGGSIPSAGWPNGSGCTHYLWRLDGLAWSAETPITTPISLSNLAPGPHYVEVVGKNDAGLYQNDPALGLDAAITRSRTWFVTPGASPLRLNEILASNDSAYSHGTQTPDVIELYNAGPAALSLAGMRLTDDPANPDKFIFPAGASIPAGGYVVVLADNPDGTPGYFTGFNLNKNGGSVCLFASVANGGALLDSVSFGIQLTDYSIGRLADGAWALCQPTLGGPNTPAPVGDPLGLKINEWLALGSAQFPDDYVELYNPAPLPVALGGLFLTDNAVGWLAQDPITPLSFLEADGYLAFHADGNPGAGADHLNFKLNGEQGTIGLADASGNLIDSIIYGSQQPDLSEGRSPNGADAFAFFAVPTPGGPNFGDSGVSTNITYVNITLLTFGNEWSYNQTEDLSGLPWYDEGAYDVSGWPTGAGLLAFENNASIAPLINTPLADPRTAAPGLTAPRVYYFRTTFDVPTNLDGFTITANARIDDGAVIYLNGSELIPIRVDQVPLTYGTLASSTPSSGDATSDDVFTIPADRLAPGPNLLAAEVHQAAVNSSDIVWGMGLTATKATTNFVGGTPLVINEVLANNAHVAVTNGWTPDWVELLNQSGEPVDLGDCSLTDSTFTSRRWVFPAGTLIPANGYLRVYCDGNLLPSTNHTAWLNTGFGLQATGGGVYLFDKSASRVAPISAVTYGVQTPDFSIGRVPDGAGPWVLTVPTGDSANIAATVAGPANLKVNEWMAAPAAGDDWFELYNPNSQPVALGGLWLSDDLINRMKSRIPPLSFIGGGSTNAFLKFHADSNTGAGADHVNFSLKASGEAVGLSTAAGMLIDGVAFGPQQTDASEGRFPDGSANLVRFPLTASPGDPNYLPLTNLVINEVLTHTDLPLEDAIELFNLAATPVDIGGWWLSDAKGTLEKYRIPDNTTVPAYGYVVFYEYQFNDTNVLGSATFALSSAQGDEVYLSAAADGQLTGYRTSVRFGPALNGISFGRYLTSDHREEFVAMSARSFGKDNPDTVDEFRTGPGAPNPYPKVGPVVISEILYHPPDVGTNDNAFDEYIELHNPSAQAIPLFDTNLYSGTNGAVIADGRTNTWHLRSAVDFNFPPNTVLPAGGFLLVVSFDPADATALASFRSHYGLGLDVAIVGPFTGKLDNGNEELNLNLPDTPDANGDAPYVLVEHVHYYDAAPWPANADGLGQSLQRVSLAGFANDPTNWVAAAPTPGAGQSGNPDRDGDGMPDAWEVPNGLDPLNPADAAADADGDGLANLQEYRAGTDPRNPNSTLALGITRSSDTELTFQAVAGKSYTVEFSDTLLPAAWQTFWTEPAGAARTVRVSDPAANAARFYRVRTP